MNYNTLFEKLCLVPDKPGVYLMKDSNGHIIYIGKAKSLTKRVGSYFRKGSHWSMSHKDEHFLSESFCPSVDATERVRGDAAPTTCCGAPEQKSLRKPMPPVVRHCPKVLAMVAKVADFDYFITATEKDALGLEANLIKKHKPHYNILLKDNKQFPYIKIVDAPFPYLEVTRKITKGGKYFGPYFDGIRAGEFMRTICDIFPVRACSTMAKEPCLNYQIGQCLAPCAGKVTREDYAVIIENVKRFLRGEDDFGAHLILENKMQAASELQQFELAIRYREGIRFLEKLKQRTITQVGRNVNCDVFGCYSAAEVFAVNVLTVRAGKLIGAQNFADENKGIQTDDEMLDGFIQQYYLENPRPDEVVVKPNKGFKKKLFDMAVANAKEYAETSIEKIKFKSQFTLGACEELAREAGLSIVPKKIECYDISNLFGEETVASMVVFIDGRAEKKLYRRFKIRSHDGIDDYKSMQEVLRRRLARIGSADDSFGVAPDLIIVDGGKGQLSAALEIISKSESFEKAIPLISIAERNEEIFVPGRSEPIVLSKRSYALRLVQRIRDEAHRFAVTFHKKLRDQKITGQFKKKR